MWPLLDGRNRGKLPQRRKDRETFLFHLKCVMWPQIYMNSDDDGSDILKLEANIQNISLSLNEINNLK